MQSLPPSESRADLPRVVESAHAGATADVAAPGRRRARGRLGRRRVLPLGVGRPLGPLAPESRPLALLQRPHPLARGRLRAVPGAVLDRRADPADRRLRRLRALGNAVHAGVRRRADRHRDLPRDDGLRAHLVRARALPDPGHVVGAEVRRAEGRLCRGDPRRLARARVHVPEPVDRGRDRDEHRPLPAAALVGRGRADLRRHRAAADLRRALPRRRAFPAAGRSAAGRGGRAPPAQGGSLGHPGQGARRPRLHARGERVHDRRWGRAARCSSSTRCCTEG